MIATRSWIGPFLLGAGAMYLLDPDNGGRRRALLRDRGVRTWHQSSEFFDKAFRDLGHRVGGKIAETRGSLTGQHPDDRVLAERVRAKLGRYVSHPHAIEVDTVQGHVVLSGAILRSEADRLLHAIRSVRGVRDVESRLEVFDVPDHVPALQGGIPRRGEAPEILQSRWAPSTQLLAGVVALTLAGLATRAVRAPHRQPATPSL